MVALVVRRRAVAPPRSRCATARRVWLGEVPERLPDWRRPAAALRTALEAAGHASRCPGCRRCPAAWSATSPTTWCAGSSGCPSCAVDDLRLPEMVMLLATDIAAVDHHEGTITLIANAVNWNAHRRARRRAYDDAVARLDVMTAALGQPLPSTVATSPARRSRVHRAQRTRRGVPRAIVESRVGDIEAGEAFQVVLSQRFEMDTDADPLDVYRMLRATNPSPYMYLLRARCGRGTALRHRRLQPGGAGHGARTACVTTHPIAGTRWRGATEEEDIAAGEGAAGRREGARRAPDARRPRAATTSAGSACRARCGCADFSRSSATATSCTWCRR